VIFVEKFFVAFKSKRKEQMKFPSYLKYILLIVIALYLFRVIRQDSKQYENFENSPHENCPDQSKLITTKTPDNSSHTCGTDGNCTSLSGKPLLPVMNPLFNMREICKEAILLQQHLLMEEKQCKDCIQKHYLTIEALAEEGLSLDKEGKYKHLLAPVPAKCRTMLKGILDKSVNPCDAAQEIRAIRKKFMPLCATVC